MNSTTVTTLYYTTLHYTKLHHTIPHYTTLHHTTPHYTTLLLALLASERLTQSCYIFHYGNYAILHCTLPHDIHNTTVLLAVWL